MDERQKLRAESASLQGAVGSGPWLLRKLEIVTTLQPRRWPMARVELLHAIRGRLCATGTGSGGLDAAFNAIGQVFGVSAALTRLDLHHSSPPDPSNQLPIVAVDLSVQVGEALFTGSGLGEDLLASCVAAYIDALRKSELGAATPA